MTTKQKPNEYADDFTHIIEELNAFVAEHDTNASMPTYKELADAGCGDLANAVRKHGGFLAIFKWLGLNIFNSDRPANYWDDFENVEQKQPDFKKPKPQGYWKDFANIEKELLAFMAKYDMGRTMPTGSELVGAGRKDLEHAIGRHHGGIPAVASRLGLNHRSGGKASGYWNNYANLEKELRTFIARNGMKGTMPTTIQLLAAKRSDLNYAIHKQGGVFVVAERLGLKVAPKFIRQKAKHIK